MNTFVIQTMLLLLCLFNLSLIVYAEDKTKEDCLISNLMPHATTMRMQHSFAFCHVTVCNGLGNQASVAKSIRLDTDVCV